MTFVRLLSRLLPLCGVFPLLPPGAAAAPPPLLPAPQHARYDGGRLVLRNGLQIVVPASCPARVTEIADVLRDELRAQAGISAEIVSGETSAPAGSVRLALTPPNAATPSPEAYTLKIGRTIGIAAADPRGLLWGAQTLLQCIDTASGPPAVPRCEIADAPASPWRALLLDPARSFLDLDFLRRTIREMSACKLNILHLHLIDDQAWRFQSKAFPKCNRPGEPFYTQAELKELVAFAARYGVGIVPEFDFPGHAMTAIAAYPDLDCEGRVRPVNDAILCIGKPLAWQLMESVVAESAEIFPSPYLDLGADEPFAIKRWETSPDCQALMKLKGVTTVTALYHAFLNDLNALAKQHGKKLIVWSDAIHAGVEPMPAKDIIIDAWTNDANVQALAADGYAIINSSFRPLYLSSFGMLGGYPLETVWQWDPTRFGLPGPKHTVDYKTLPAHANILGGQACIWATEETLAERRLYPRLFAVAETLWSGPRRPDFASFEARVPAAMARLRQLGAPDYDALPSEALFTRAEKDGVISAPALRTAQNYRDFILTFERRADAPSADTGLIIRCAPAVAGAPRGFAVPAVSPWGQPIPAWLPAPGGWHQFELVARGAIVSLTVDGYLLWSVPDPAPRAGPIALTGAESEFKNIQLRVLAPPSAP